MKLSKPTVVRRKLAEAFGIAAPLASRTRPEIAKFFTSASRVGAPQLSKTKETIRMTILRSSSRAIENGCGKILEDLSERRGFERRGSRFAGDIDASSARFTRFTYGEAVVAEAC